MNAVKNLVIFASGAGSNARAIINFIRKHAIFSFNEGFLRDNLKALI